MSIINKIYRKIIINALQNLNDQEILEQVLIKTLNKMNFGNGGKFSQSGELFVLNYIQNKLGKDSIITIFDVGANVGEYSKAVAQRINKQSSIYSFEPSKKTFQQFQETTREFKNIIGHQLGFSNERSNQTLYSNTDGSGLASVYQRKLDHFGINMDIKEDIKLETIDEFCLNNKIDKINFLKLDIEGHELNALKGASKMINENKIDFIQFEFGGCNIDSRTYFQDFFYFLKDKYKIYRILKDGLFELKNYKETNEIFITINYLAERK